MYFFDRNSTASNSIYKNGYVMNENSIEMHIYSNCKDTKLIFDKEEFFKLSNYFWCRADVGREPYKKPMIYTNINKQKIKLSRVILNLIGEDVIVEHLNRNCLDFKKENLHIVTNNIRLRQTKKDIPTGVFESKYNGKTNGYCVPYYNSENKQITKFFSKIAYNNQEEALKNAIEFRLSMQA